MNIPEYKPLFNIRVYGLLEHEGHILISDELHSGRRITKFPGGGLQFGEGISDCLLREFREELEMDIQIQSHFYTTDFFQPSAFDPNQQVISIYYQVSSPTSGEIPTTNILFDFKPEAGITQRFRWIDKKIVGPDHFTFPIDKKVAEMIAARLRG